MKRIIKQLLKSSRLVLGYRERLYQTCGISPLGASYITEICKEPGITQERLAERLMVNKSSVTRGLSRLQSEGLIFRQEDTADKRTRSVYPTERAKEQQEKLCQCDEFLLKAMFVEFSEKEQKQLLTLLKRLSRRAESLCYKTGGLTEDEIYGAAE